MRYSVDLQSLISSIQDLTDESPIYHSRGTREWRKDRQPLLFERILFSPLSMFFFFTWSFLVFFNLMNLQCSLVLLFMKKNHRLRPACLLLFLQDHHLTAWHTASSLAAPRAQPSLAYRSVLDYEQKEVGEWEGLLSHSLFFLSFLFFIFLSLCFLATKATCPPPS